MFYLWQVTVDQVYDTIGDTAGDSGRFTYNYLDRFVCLLLQTACRIVHLNDSRSIFATV